MIWVMRSLGTGLTAALLCACSGSPSGEHGSGETGEPTCIEQDPEPLDFVEGCWVNPGPRPSCLIRSHAIIECGQASWFDAGIRAAVEGGRATLLASNGEGSWLLHASPEAYEVERLPPEFVGAFTILSQDAEGELAFALSEGENLLQGTSGTNLRYATRDGDGWGSSLALEGEPLLLRDFELTAAGLAKIWYLRVGDSQTYQLVGDIGDIGEWTSTNVDASGDGRRDNLGRDDQEWRFAYTYTGDSVQLMGFEGDLGEGLGQPTFPPRDYIALPPARPPATEGPTAVVVAMRPDGLHLFGSGGSDVVIPDSQPYADTCTDEPDDCSMGCHETGLGVGAQDFAGARATDGSVWIGWVTQQRDVMLDYHKECDGPDGPCVCVYSGTSNDHSTQTLHIARVVGAEVEELVSLDVPPLVAALPVIAHPRRSIDMRAFGDRLAVGLTYDTQPPKLALLDIDIGAIE